jgi:hypothetical protein
MYDNRILEKKLEDSATKSTDYAADGELTVTITVHEYRKLVEDSVRLSYTSKELDDTLTELDRLKSKFAAPCTDRCYDPSRVKIE